MAIVLIRVGIVLIRVGIVLIRVGIVLIRLGIVLEERVNVEIGREMKDMSEPRNEVRR